MFRLIILFCIITSNCYALEADYTKIWCYQQNGMIEVRLADATRCDCLTKTHAIEVDYASKFYEAVGQSLHYSIITGKLPGILLLMKDKSDQIYLVRLKKIILKYKLPITIWIFNISN